jgi:hypothetical protein
MQSILATQNNIPIDAESVVHRQAVADSTMLDES